MRMVPDWLIASVWFTAGLLGTGALWYFLGQKRPVFALWAGFGTAAFALLAVSLQIHNGLRSGQAAALPDAVAVADPANAPGSSAAQSLTVFASHTAPVLQAGRDIVLIAPSAAQSMALVPTHAPPATPTPLPPENVRTVVEIIASPDAAHLFAVKVTIQSSAVVSPVAFRLHFSGPVAGLTPAFSRTGALIGLEYGVQGTVAEYRVSHPPLTPQDPVIVVVVADGPVSLTRLERLF